MTIRESVRSFFTTIWKSVCFSPRDQMLEMELNNLKFRFDRIAASKAASDAKDKRYADLETALAKPEKTWDDAYLIENQIAMLLSGERLHQEIIARLREAVERNARDAAALQKDYSAQRKSKEKNGRTNDDEFFRNLLLQVLENIHWEQKLKHLKREVRLKATRNTLLIALVALLFVLLPYFIWLPACIWTHFGLYTALTFGLLGALFSRLLTLQSSALTLEDLRNARKGYYIFLRACIGACGALIVYFFLQSGLLRGNAFPDFAKLVNDVASVRDGKVSEISDLARLIMWSFIAGFSEYLVPSVLSNTERQLRGVPTPRP